MLKTAHGGVPLRWPREKELIVDADGTPHEISRNWLLATASDKAKYLRLSKRAMLVASDLLKLSDGAIRVGAAPADPRTRSRRGQQRPEGQEARERLAAHLAGLRGGSVPVPLPPMGSIMLTAAEREERQPERILCVKKTQCLSRLKMAWAKFDNGWLKLYKYNIRCCDRYPSKPTHVYDLRKAKAFYESQGGAAPHPKALGRVQMRSDKEPFIPNYDHRVLLVTEERPFGPLFLYAETAEEALILAKAVAFSKYLHEFESRTIAAAAIDRATRSYSSRAWPLLFRYLREIESTRASVRRAARKLIYRQVDKGWTKLRMVYEQRLAEERRREELAQRAIRMLEEKLTSIRTRQAKFAPFRERQVIIDRVQRVFRRHKLDMLQDGIYQVSAVVPHLQQALTGIQAYGAFTSLTRKHVLLLLLQGKALQHCTRQDAMTSKEIPAYSAGSIPLGGFKVAVTENFMQLGFQRLHSSSADSGLETSRGWNPFVNVDRISSVVLHTERIVRYDGTQLLLDPEGCAGPWITINGPRVCWSRFIRTNRETNEHEAVGVHNGLLRVLSGEPLKWVRLDISVKSAAIDVEGRPKPSAEPVGDDEVEPMETPRPGVAPSEADGELDLVGLGGGLQRVQEVDLGEDKQSSRFSCAAPCGPGKRPQQLRTEILMLLHCFGRQHRSAPLSGSTFAGTFVTELPIVGEEDDVLALFERSEVSIDVVERAIDSDYQRTLCHGRFRLNEVFSQPTEGHLTHITVPMVRPLQGIGQAFLADESSVELEIACSTQHRPSAPPCISPELIGRGNLTSLFTSQRSAWYDEALGPARQPGGGAKAAGFAELAVEDLAFHEAQAEKGRLFRYHVAASLGGAWVHTAWLHRPDQAWLEVFSVDPDKINFAGARLFVPLPPGSWSSPKEPPCLEVSVWRVASTKDMEASDLSFTELMMGRKGKVPDPPTRVYHVRLSLAGMQCDQEFEDIPVPLSKPSEEEPPKYRVLDLSSARVSKSAVPAMLRLSAALRDRDYVRLEAGRLSAGPQLSHTAVVCVGEKVLIPAEQPIAYPANASLYRKRLYPGHFDDSLVGTVPWSAPLRNPNTTHERKTSGMIYPEDEMVDLVEQVKPTNTEDVVPHKFLLTGSEVEFIKSRRPGCFWRVVEEVKKSYMVYSEEPEEQVIVTSLTHLMRHLPAVVLATYADMSCDVELLPSFLRQWQTEPTKRFSIPGEVKVVEVDEDPGDYVARLPPGAADGGQYKTRRVILRGLPLHCVTAAQSAGFNVFDAAFGGVEEALQQNPRQFCNSFNPRMGNMEDDRGAYAVYAGPLPPDVGPECQHEWSFHLNMKSEREMYHFVTSLRHAAQEVLHQQLKQVGKYEQSAMEQTRHVTVGAVARGGHLEVVLMEAKNLRPTKVLPDRDIFSAMQRMSKVDLNVGATFKLMPSQDGDPLAFNGQKLQSAPAVVGNNPTWSKIEDLMHSGGWVFKTPDMDPRRMPESYFEVEVQNVGISPQVLGHVRVPLTGRSTIPTPWSEQRVNLCDPKSPFHDMWLPLQQEDQGDEDRPRGSGTATVTGLIHVMTLWVPETQPGPKKAPLMTASAWRAQLLGRRLLEEPPRDPAAPLALQVHGYNPNAQRGGQAETRFAALARHMESSLHTQVMLNGLEYQASVAWAAFRLRPQSSGWPPAHLAGWREDRLKAGELQGLVELDTLLRRGVPSKDRWRVWSEISRADTTQQLIPGAGSFRFRADASEVQEGLARYASIVSLCIAASCEVSLQILEDQTDFLHWEASPQNRSAHWSLVQQAGRVCMALVMFSAPAAPSGSGGSSVLNYQQLGRGARGLAYCQSLLVVAYFLLLSLQRVEWPEEAEQQGAPAGAGAGAAAGPRGGQDRSGPPIAAAEARAFWLLFALAGPPHSDYEAYYCMPPEGYHSGSDAMDDVFRLTLILSHEDSALHTHLAALGFHLSIVFYGAFMRLFATFLPTATLFRLWDILFAELDNPARPPEKPRRHSLVELAFGALHACRERLLRCQSARDARDCVLDQLESLHDPASLAELIAEVEARIWQQPLKSALGASHAADYERAQAVWEEHFFKPFRTQVSVIRTAMAERGDFTWHTKDIASSLIPNLAKEHDSDGGGAKYGGLLRQTPQKVLALQDLDGSVAGTLEHSIRNWYSRRFSDGPAVELVVVTVPPPHGSRGEPEGVDAVGFARMLEKATEGSAWSSAGNSKLAAAFEAPITMQERRVSPNEVLAALICCSRGTVGEKALALFELYGFRQEGQQLRHAVATSTAARLVLKNAGARGEMAPNAISIEACRLLVQGILARSMHKVTNREAALLADHTFGRAGAVPAILDAILVKGAVPGHVRGDLRKLRQRYDGPYADVRRKLTIAHEVQVALCAGRLDLCFAAGATHLRDLRIQDPYAGQKKVLWIRYARGGDGERQNAFLDVDERGFLSEAEVRLDVGHASEAGSAQMTISREEFLSCFLASPLLSEALRQLTSSEPGSLEWRPLQQQKSGPGGELPRARAHLASVREFIRQNQKSRARPVEALNEYRECFGYALYTHVEDADSTEWRKAIIHRADPAGRFQASLIHSRGGEAAVEKLARLGADAVLLAPPAPRILESGCKEHEEFLAKAPELHEAGFTVEEIQRKLNEELTAQWRLSKPKPDQVELPLISLVDVQHTLRRAEAPRLLRENSSAASTGAEG